MSKFDVVIGNIQDFEELKAYAEAQYETLQSQLQKITDLEAKNKHLEHLLAQTVPVVGESSPSNMSDEERICRDQLRIFNQTSKERELTLEETRKVEIYSKILANLDRNPKKAKSPTEDMPIGQLLELVKE